MTKFAGKTKAAFVATIGMPDEVSEKMRPAGPDRLPETLKMILGKWERLYASGTLQCDGYKPHHIEMFDEKQKRKHHDETWEGTLAQAFGLAGKVTSG